MKLWDWLTTSRHTRWLESEVERLREDRDEARRQVWALVNSLVTTAGAPLPQEILRHAARADDDSRPPERRLTPRGKRSWHQRALELELESRRDLQTAPRGDDHAPSDRHAQDAIATK